MSDLSNLPLTLLGTECSGPQKRQHSATSAFRIGGASTGQAKSRPPLKLSERKLGWRVGDLIEWLNSRVREVAR